jgi:hypothetical protein
MADRIISLERGELREMSKLAFLSQESLQLTKDQEAKFG